MKKNTKFILISGLIVLLSSCGLFRRKNRCMDCPKWSLEQSVQPENGKVNS